MTRMRLATNSVWRDANGNRQEQAEYHTVISFGRLAEICAAYCVKGRRIFVEGKLRYREYDASDGQRKVATEIVADVVRLLDRREGTGEHDALDREAEAPAVEPALATA